MHMLPDMAKETADVIKLRNSDRDIILDYLGKTNVITKWEAGGSESEKKM